MVIEVVADKARSPISRKIAEKWAKSPPSMVTSPAAISATTGIEGGLKSSSSKRGSCLGDGRGGSASN